MLGRQSAAIGRPRVCAEAPHRDAARPKPHPFVEHIPRLRRYARALVRDPDAADDLVQDTLERAANKLHLWRPGSDMRAWLFAILHNLFINQTKKLRPVVALDPDQLPAILVKPTQSVRLEIADVEKALQAVSAEQREVLLLVAIEQMTYEEVARTLSIPLGTVMSRLSRAREHLRRLTQSRGGTG
ncbi:MAG: RNA polymerase sigma factor [Betaproteobacteria bacterium]|nr:RNA polymerase sigma factor [Betaproteobacteria bacterium]